MKQKNYNYNVIEDLVTIRQIIAEIVTSEKFTVNDLRKLLKKFPKQDGIFSRDQLVAGYRELVKRGELILEQKIIDRIKMKPTRTMSGVAPVTVLTMPFPCPGKCIFCPTDIKMPKSYLSSEPGAQRAERNAFDPYLQTYNRLLAFHNTGHSVEKVELIVLGGTWSFYPLAYRIWFIKRCYQAMNDFGVCDMRDNKDNSQIASWEELEQEQVKNENAKSRNVGLVLETRPDYVDQAEIITLRRLGATKVQIGIQSMNEEVLAANERGHTVYESIRAINMLRRSGFKIHTHWMPNLYLANPDLDKQDYLKLWNEVCPDELKIYPTSIIKDTPLYDLYLAGKYSPYDQQELLDVLKHCFINTPRYCRLTRVIRDIPAPDIVAGNKTSNLRQIVEADLLKEGEQCNCIRCREIKNQQLNVNDLMEENIEYETSVGKEYFLSIRTRSNDKIAGFLRLFLPKIDTSPIAELNGEAIIREVHVYGQVVDIGMKTADKTQHLGLGSQLITSAESIARSNGFRKIAVISAIGTREYYRKQGYQLDNLYMHKNI